MAGLVLLLGAVAYVQHWVAGMRYEVAPYDPVTFGAATCGVLGMPLAAVWWPARHAAAIDPQQVLRHE
jgi:hypothetical protein